MKAQTTFVGGTSFGLVPRVPDASLIETPDSIEADDARDLAIEAYVFGYPLVLVDVTKQVMTAVTPTTEKNRAPINQFQHARELPDPTYTDLASPNADTLCSTAWLDLSKEPMILSVPDMGERYYVMMLMDAWTDVLASPGTRTTGNDPGELALVGPRWTEGSPRGMRQIRSPTDLAWLVGRTQTNGASDYPAVHRIQNQYQLTPLSAWGNRYAPPSTVYATTRIDVRTPPAVQVARMSTTTFFGRLNALLKNNPAAAADVPALRRFKAIGIAPGRPFNLRTLSPEVAEGVAQSTDAGQAVLRAEAQKSHGAKINGWDMRSVNTASFGTDYARRALVAQLRLGANLPRDALYPRATTDARGRPLHGANRYVIRFAKGRLPPVNAFWSITLYNATQALVHNSIGRYAIGDRNALQADSDGSTTIYIQHASPGADKESNWLPAPPDAFNLMMRLYWPDRVVTDGRWRIPPVERVE